MNNQKSSFAKASEDKTKKHDNQKTDTGKLKDELERLKKEVENYKNKYLRVLADYQNNEKRTISEKLQIKEHVVAQVLTKLLPFLDNLDKAEIFIKDSGLKMIKDSFYKSLTEMGLTEIQISGKEFDPHLAEAVDIVPGEKDNVVKEILRRGYTFNGKILRVAQVRVSKKIIN